MNPNKITIKQKGKICFEDFPVGTIFEADGDILIKISRADILSEIEFVIREGKCTIDTETLPNAVNLVDGTVAYFRLDEEVTAVYPSATVSIE